MDLRRWLGAVFLALGGALLLTACHGKPHTFTVSTFTDGSDAVPGDGICEVTPGTGDCSLRAAIDEANTTPDNATVLLPEGTYMLSDPGTDDTNAGGDLDITRPGTLTLSGQGAGAAITAPGLDGVLDNHTGTLAIDRIAVSDATGPGITIRTGAAATIALSSLHHNSGPGLLIETGATANTLHSTVSTNGTGGVRVDGAFVADYATITANTGGGITGTGTPTVGQSIIAHQTSGTNCAVPATSGNWNTSNDTSCAWNGPDDLSAGTWSLQPLSADLVPFHVPVPGSRLMDSIPADSGVCGTLFKNTDQTGAARPVGHGCDRGAIEAGGLSLVVNSASDVLDANPGDGICDIGNGNCTARAAVAETNAHAGPDVITLAASPTLTRAGASEHANLTGDLDVLDSLTVEGGGHTINGGQLDRVFEIRAGWFELHDAAVTGGRTPTSGPLTEGGGIAVTIGFGDLELVDVEVWGNNAGGDGGGVLARAVVVERSVIRDNAGSRGGGLRAETAEIVDSTISGNRAGHGGGIWTRSTLDVLRSTISNNYASANGGGIYAFECLNPTGACPSHVELTASTISGNTADLGAAFYREASFGWATTTFRSSTIVDNVATGVPSTGQVGSAVFAQATKTFGATIVANNSPRDCSYAATTSLGGNLDEDGTCGFGAGDLPSADPLLGPLADNGGPTRTHLPFAISPARDAIPAGTPGLCDDSLPIDQRGQPRPVGGGCDVGAVEGHDPNSVPMALVVDTGADGADTTPGDHVCAAANGCTLRAAIDEVNAAPHPLNRITIAVGVDPVLSIPGLGDDANDTGDLDVLAPVTIFGGGASIDAAHLDRVLDVASTGVMIDEVTIRGGRLTDVDGGGAGVQVRSGGLTLQRSTVTDNQIAGNDGRGAGLAARPSTTVLVHRSTFNANFAWGWEAFGGAMYADDATLSVTVSTVSGNHAFFGGGVASGGNAQVTVQVSTVTANTGWSTLNGSMYVVGSAIGPGSTKACDAARSTSLSTWFDSSCGTATGFAGVDPLLDPLADNGGPTLTHRPQLESPLRDRIVPGSNCAGLSPVDQRGQPRPHGTGCDIGSFEGS